MVFTKNLKPATTKGITLNFAIGLVAFTKNLRLVLGFAKSITLSLPLRRIKIDAKSL